MTIQLTCATLLAATTLALPALAQDPAAPRQYFARHQMGATKAPDDSTLNIKVGSDT